MPLTKPNFTLNEVDMIRDETPEMDQEARLSATGAGIAPFDAETAPDRHYLLTLGWLRRAGLVDDRAETFIRTVFAPVEDSIREALIALLQMRWAGAEPELSRREQAEYRRLCQPESPDFILTRPDCYAFFTYSLLCGRVAT